MKKYLAGHTRKITWVSSGVVPTSISAAVIDAGETIVSSQSMTSSGNGHFYSALTMPSTAGFYVIETSAIVSTKPYKTRSRFKIVLSEVD